MHPFENVDGLRLDGKFHSRAELTARNFDSEEMGSFQHDILAFAAELVSDLPQVSVSTSGSTGAPKELSFHKSAVWKSAEATNEFFGMTSKSRVLLALPMEYIAGKMMVARALAGGYELICVTPCTNPVVEIPVGTRIDFASFTPHQATIMARENPERLATIGKILLGGSATSDKLRQNLCSIGCEAFIGFGMAETLSHFAVARLSDAEEPVYLLLSGVDISTDGRNRLVVHRPGILDEPLVTNDVVELTKGGFRWLGRADNAIITGGVNVFPEQIEKKLAPRMHGAFFVAGVSHDTLGQQVALFISDKKDGEVSFDGLGLQPFEMPKKTVLLEDFLHTESGKVRRKATVDRWLEDGGWRSGAGGWRQGGR